MGGKSVNLGVDAIVVAVIALLEQITGVSVDRAELMCPQWHLYAANVYELKLGCGGVY